MGLGRGTGSAARTHQLRRLLQPGAQAAELLGGFPSRGEGPARQREDAAAGPAGPAGSPVVSRAEQPLAPGGRAGLRSEPTADLERERVVGQRGRSPRWRDLGAPGEANQPIAGDKVSTGTLAEGAGELAALALQKLCTGTGTEPALPDGLTAMRVAQHK